MQPCPCRRGTSFNVRRERDPTSPLSAAGRLGSMYRTAWSPLLVRLLFASAALLCCATVTAAQSSGAAEHADDEGPSISTSFAALRSLVRDGETVIVSMADGTTVRGRLGSLSDSALELVDVTTPSPVIHFTETSARKVRVIRRDSSRDGMLYGTLAGVPPFTAWSASGSGTKTSTAVAIIGGSVAIGALTGWLTDRALKDVVTVYEAPPATTIEELRLLTTTGDRLLVTSRDGRRLSGRLSRLSHTSLELERALPLPTSDILQVQVERRDRWWPSAVMGVATAMFFTPGLSYTFRCSNHGVTHEVVNGVTYLQSPCIGFDTPAGDYALFGLTGAAAGATIDWLRRDRTTVFRAPASQAGARSHVVPTLSRTGSGLQVSLSF